MKKLRLSSALRLGFLASLGCLLLLLIYDVAIEEEPPESTTAVQENSHHQNFETGHRPRRTLHRRTWRILRRALTSC